MKTRTRIRAAACAALVALALSPARAVEPVRLDIPKGGAWTGVGGVKAAVLHPTIPRALYVQYGSQANGLVGWVFKLPAIADGRVYTLVRNTKTTNYEHLDVYFYEDIQSSNGHPLGRICPDGVKTDTNEVESGTICPGPMKGNFAVVVLRSGVMSNFTLSYPDDP